MMRRQVAAAAIQRDGLVLVAQRKTGVYAGKWEFPGGKVEPGELPPDALVREIEEELGVVIEVGELIAEVKFSVDADQYVLLAYLAEHLVGEYRPVDHCRIDWVMPSQLLLLDLAPVDVVVATKLASTEGHLT